MGAGDLRSISDFNTQPFSVSGLRYTRRCFAEHFSLVEQTEHSAPTQHPHPRPCHLQDGQQENSVLNTTSEQMFAPL